MRSLFPFLFLLSLLIPNFFLHALEPHELLVIANRTDTHSIKLAQFYMQKRSIPSHQLITVSITNDETCNRLDYITRFINELQTGTVNIWEVPGYRIEMSPFGGIKDSGLGYKEGVIEAMKSYTNIKTYSLPWE